MSVERNPLKDGDILIFLNYEDQNRNVSDIEVSFHGIFQHSWTESGFDGNTTQHAGPRATIGLPDGSFMTTSMGRLRRKIVKNIN